MLGPRMTRRHFWSSGKSSGVVTMSRSLGSVTNFKLWRSRLPPIPQLSSVSSGASSWARSSGGGGHSDITIGPALGQSVKQNVRVEMASLELHKFAGFFEVDGTPVRIAAVSSINGDAAPTGVIATGQHVILMEPVDENGGTLAQATCRVLAVVLPRYRGRTVVVQIGREQRRELALDPADINRREGLAGAGRCAPTSLDDGFSFGAAQDDSVSGIKHFSGICGGGCQECTHGEHARGQ